jgi:hypothetical protein
VVWSVWAAAAVPVARTDGVPGAMRSVDAGSGLVSSVWAAIAVLVARSDVIAGRCRA